MVETSAGKVVEKRLNATVMRRRHTEPEAGFAHAAAEPDEPFHFELEGEREDAFATPFLEERSEPAESAIPALFDNEPENEPEPARPARLETAAPHTAPAAEHPAEAPSAHAAPNGAAARAEQPIAEPGPAELPDGEAKTDTGIRNDTIKNDMLAAEAVKAEAAKPKRPRPKQARSKQARLKQEGPRRRRGPSARLLASRSR